jgi:hypothetical protein
VKVQIRVYKQLKYSFRRFLVSRITSCSESSMPICGGIWRRSFSPSKSFLNLCKDPISAGSCWILFDVKTNTSRLVQNPMSDGTYSILFSSSSRTRSDFMLPIVSGRNSSRLFEILSSKLIFLRYIKRVLKSTLELIEISNTNGDGFQQITGDIKLRYSFPSRNFRRNGFD